MAKSKKVWPSFERSPDKTQLFFTSGSGNVRALTLANAACILNEVRPFLFRPPHHSGPPPEDGGIQFSFESTISRPSPSEPPAPIFVATASVSPIGNFVPPSRNRVTSSAMSTKQDAKNEAALKLCELFYDLRLPPPVSSNEPNPTCPIPPDHPGQTKTISAQKTVQSENRDNFTSPPHPTAQCEPIALKVQPLVKEAKSPVVEVYSNRNLIAPSPPDLPENVKLSSVYPFGSLHPDHQDASSGIPAPVSSDQIWCLHRISVPLDPPKAGRCLIGLICAENVLWSGTGCVDQHQINDLKFSFAIEDTHLMRLSSQEAVRQFKRLDTFTRLVTQVVVNRFPFSGKLTLLLAPLGPDGSIDWDVVDEPVKPVVESSQLSENPDTLIVCRNEAIKFRLFTFRQLAIELKPDSPPSAVPMGSPLSRFFKHLSKFQSIQHFYAVVLGISPKQRVALPLVHLDAVLRQEQDALQVLRDGSPREEAYQALLPQSILEISTLALPFWRVVAYLPFWLRALHDRACAYKLKEELRVPSLSTKLVIEALTPPGRAILPHFQTLETVGDSFLKLATTIQLYHAHPTAGEGQLTSLRSRATDNVCLRRKLHESQLAGYILCDEFRALDNFVMCPVFEEGVASNSGTLLEKHVPRKLLSDVTEALLGAAYLSGGIGEALKVGDRLGLLFGGVEPWEERPYQPLPPGDATASSSETEGLTELQSILGYSFRNISLLQRALTHASAALNPMAAYERQEWLGDALLDLWTIDRLYNRLNPISSSQLTLMRACLCSNASLGFLALRKLSLHLLISHQLENFSIQTRDALEDLSGFETVGLFYADLVNTFTAADPPKVLADTLEAILGAIFLDSGHQLSTVFVTLDRIYLEAMDLLRLCEPRDPVSEIHEIRSLSRCRQILSVTRHAHTLMDGKSGRNQECSVTHHGVSIGESRHSVSKALAEQRASLEAMANLNRNQFNHGKKSNEKWWEVCDCLGNGDPDVRQLENFKTIQKTETESHQNEVAVGDGDQSKGQVEAIVDDEMNGVEGGVGTGEDEQLEAKVVESVLVKRPLGDEESEVQERATLRPCKRSKSPPERTCFSSSFVQVDSTP